MFKTGFEKIAIKLSTRKRAEVQRYSRMLGLSKRETKGAVKSFTIQSPNLPQYGYSPAKDDLKEYYKIYDHYKTRAPGHTYSRKGDPRKHLKVFQNERKEFIQKLQKDPSARQRFVDEARAGMSLKDKVLGAYDKHKIPVAVTGASTAIGGYLLHRKYRNGTGGGD